MTVLPNHAQFKPTSLVDAPDDQLISLVCLTNSHIKALEALSDDPRQDHAIRRSWIRLEYIDSILEVRDLEMQLEQAKARQTALHREYKAGHLPRLERKSKFKR